MNGSIASFARALLAGVLMLAALPPLFATPPIPDDWAFQPLNRPTLPTLTATPPPGTASTNPIDLFIRATLARRNLQPSPPADARTLIRRLYFDLVGLPPSRDDVESFVHDASSAAYEKLVNRLLASSQYGERWARHWLDVVRFGESQGFEYDRIRDHAWRYRDYIIKAFNSDKRYDQFIREQLAGDVLEPVTQEGIVATGFLVAGPWDQAGNSSASASVRAASREAELEDMLGTVGQTFLGVTLNCARCHNHKFDPIPQSDYYRVKAVFQGVRHGDRSILTPEQQKLREAEATQRKEKVADAEARISTLEANARTRVASKTRAARPHSSGSSRPGEPPPVPFARWTFESNAHDSLGRLHARLEGGARIAGGRLVLDGKDAFAITEPLTLPIGEKTLEAWVALNTLDQGGGGVVSVESDNGQRFDAIVFGERQAGRWMAGSDSFVRTRDFDAPVETSTPDTLIHIAIVYRGDRSIAIYRNGAPYGPSYQLAEADSAFITFPAGHSRVLFGKRHTGGGRAMLAGEIEEARLYDRALTAGQVAESFRAGPDAAPVTREQLLAELTDAERQQHARLQAERDRLLARAKEESVAPMSYAAKPEKPEATFVLHRGEPDKARDQVLPGSLSAIKPISADLGLSADSPEAERRRRFADWVADPRNPLTARVIVNRVWHYHFGRGLVATPNDFGKMGDRPSHPELLDWLAGWFVAPDGANWSLKKLHRLILTSATWQQDSGAIVQTGRDSRPESDQSVVTSAAAIDGDNRLLWRFSPRRLEVEAVRDAMLALSGELNPSMGGPGFRPFRHVGNGGQNEYFASDPTGPEFNRRTVYRICVHSARDPLLDSLDCPEYSTRTSVRPSTTTPLQALSLMNSSFVQRQAAKLAERVAREAGPGRGAQVRDLWLRCYAREPGGDELERATTLAKDQGLQTVAWAMLNSSEFVFMR